MPMHLVCIDYTMILRESHADSKIIKRKPPLSVVVCRDFFFQHFHHPFARVMAVFSLSAHREDRDADMIANFGNVKTAECDHRKSFFFLWRFGVFIFKDGIHTF